MLWLNARKPARQRWRLFKPVTCASDDLHRVCRRLISSLALGSMNSAEHREYVEITNGLSPLTEFYSEQSRLDA
jgi:hypothetical protein